MGNIKNKIDVLELFVLVLHEYSTGDDINNTNRVPTAGCHLGGRFIWVFGVRFENHLPDLEYVKTEGG